MAVIAAVLLTAVILATWSTSEVQDVSITWYDVNATSVTTVRPTGF